MQKVSGWAWGHLSSSMCLRVDADRGLKFQQRLWAGTVRRGLSMPLGFSPSCQVPAANRPIVLPAPGNAAFSLVPLPQRWS